MVIALVAFGSVAAVARSRTWALRPTVRQAVGFVAVGVVITIVAEWLATRVLSRWVYAESSGAEGWDRRAPASRQEDAMRRIR